MRIAIDNRVLVDHTGIGRYARNLVRALSRVDGSQEYFLVGGDTPGVPDYGMEQVRVGSMGTRESSAMRYEHFALPNALKRLHIQVFHAMFTYIPLLAGCRKVFTFHDLTPLLYPEYHRKETYEYLRRWAGLYVEASDAVVAVSESTKADIARFWPRASDKTYVIPDAASDMFRRRPVSSRTAERLRSWGVDRDYVLYVGTLEPRKNIVRTINAYKMLHDRYGNSVKLLLAGPRGWGSDDLDREIARAGLDGKVVLPGRVDDETLVDIYNGCLFFVYPSLYEGFGLPPLEALMCGKAVITSGVSSLPEVTGEAALYVDPTDVESIFGAMEQLLTDEALRRELESKGPVQAQKFSWEKSARGLKVLYRMLQ